MRAFWTIAACVAAAVVVFGSFFGTVWYVDHVQAPQLQRVEVGE